MHKCFYSSPLIRQKQRAAGRSVGQHRVTRLMSCNQLRAMTRKAFRPCTKASSRAGDITHIHTSSGWRYLAVSNR